MRKLSLVRLVLASLTGIVAVIGLLMLLPEDVDAGPALQVTMGFGFSSIDSPQTAGEPFTVTITAYDNGAVNTNYTGTAILTDTTGTIYPARTDAFIEGVWTGTVTITRTGTVTITAEDESEGLIGASEPFEVDPGALVSFAFGEVASPQTAGEPFGVTVTAYDGEGNVKTDYVGPADLGDSTETIDPAVTTGFVDGVWAGDVTISDTGTDVTITAADGAITGTSNVFEVVAGGFASFGFETIGSPQTAGEPFGVTVTAYDGEGNVKTDYVGPADLSDTTGTISPTETGTFSQGTWTGDVTIRKVGTDVRITVDDEGVEGTSNAFNVIPGDLASFVFDAIASPQTAGVGFTVVITAYDGEGNVKTDYAGPAVLTDTTATIDPTETDLFLLGVWTNTVTITKTVSGGTITVAEGTVEGTSNPFTIEPAALDHIVISPTETIILAGAQQEYSAAAFDRFENLRSDVTDETEFQIVRAVEAGGMWTDNAYTSENYGTWTVRGEYTPDPREESESDEAILIVLDTDLRFTKTDNDELVNAGDMLTYELTYRNDGNEDADGIVITDTLSSYIQYVEDSCQTDVGTCRFEDNRVVFDGITIPAGGERRASLRVQVLDPLPAGAQFVRNRASLTSPASQVPFTVQDIDAIETRSDLAVAITRAPSLFSPGRVMTFTVTHGNTGRMHAQGVIISATLPEGTSPTTETLATWDSSDGVTYTYIVGGDGELLAGETGRSVLFAVRHPEQPEIAAPRFSSRFAIAADAYTGGDADPTNNVIDHLVGVPDLIITNLEVAPWPLEPDVPVVFTITVKNRGSGWAWNPDNQGGFWADIFLEPVSSYPFERYSGRGIAVVSPPLAPGAEIELVAEEVYPWIDDLRGPILFSEEDVGEIATFYAKIDNFQDPDYGLVPEYDEANNVWPALSRRLYLPLIARGQ